MRRARIKTPADEAAAVYHLMSRTVNGEWLIAATGKEVLRKQLWQVADFCGLEIITYTILSNHFHVLVRVPQKVPLSDEELLRRYRVLYPRPTKYQLATLAAVESQLRTNGPQAVAWRRRQLGLMNDISQYMKLVKERFSIWHNQTHDRFGPVWSDRFKSILIDARSRAIETAAAYIDLNCVRAGLVQDPKDYRFCGYSEAVAGRAAAQRGLRSVLGGAGWSEMQAAYRKRLFGTVGAPRENRVSISAEKIEQVMREGGQLALDDVLRCRIRYLTEGAVLGSRTFVETQLALYRERHGCGHRMMARLLPSITDWGELAGLRRIRAPLFG